MSILLSNENNSCSCSINYICNNLKDADKVNLLGWKIIVFQASSFRCNKFYLDVLKEDIQR